MPPVSTNLKNIEEFNHGVTRSFNGIVAFSSVVFILDSSHNIVTTPIICFFNIL